MDRERWTSEASIVDVAVKLVPYCSSSPSLCWWAALKASHFPDRGRAPIFSLFFFFPEGNSWHCRVLGRRVCHVSFQCRHKFRQNVPAASHPNLYWSTHVISFFTACGASIQKVRFQHHQNLIAHDPMAHPRSVALISHNFRQVFWNDAEICHN